MAPLVIAQGES